MKTLKSLGRKWMLWGGLLAAAVLTGCDGGYAYYGDTAPYYGPDYYYGPGAFWGGDVYLYDGHRGDWDHHRDRDWSRRGFESRGSVHGGGTFRGSTGTFHGHAGTTRSGGAHAGGGFREEHK